MTKDQLEAENWILAHSWADGLGLEYAGVRLDDCVVYSVLSTLGRLTLNELAQAAPVTVPDAVLS